MSESLKNSNKRIAKNAIFLYLRLLFTLIIGLYTSRLVLNTLGVVDYGIYNIVGGVVAALTFLQSSLGGATTRFINIHMIESINKLRVVFNTALIMHIMLAVIVFILAETIGLWLVYNKLTIPDDRFSVALITYQLSIVSVLVSIIQIPYDATIIAHEKMNIYAYFSITQATLNLAIVIIVQYSSFDKLLSYAALVLIVFIITRVLVHVYCRRNFDETKFSFIFEKKIFKEMTAFFGWDLYGNMSIVFRLEGINILQNIFFGPIINASVSIVNQAQNGLLSLGNSLNLAVKPQVTQSYARNDLDRMLYLLDQGTRLAFYLVLIASLPIIFNAEFILNIWLGQIPRYSPIFLELSLITSVIGMSFSLLTPVIHATGKMAAISIITGSIYLISLPLTYFLFKIGLSPVAPYYLHFIVVILAGLSNLYIVQTTVIGFSAIIFFKKVLFRMYIVFMISLAFGYLIKHYLYLHSIVSIIFILITTTFIIGFIGFSTEERKQLFKLIQQKINLKKI